MKTPSPHKKRTPNAPVKFKRRIEAPRYVEPDMMYGLESISCELAHEFYLQHRNRLIKLSDRKEVEVLYMKTYKYWCPVHLKSSPRHTKQIMYALANYLRVCDINKGAVKWYAYVELPHAPRGFSNQQMLINNVTMTRGSIIRADLFTDSSIFDSNDKGKMLLSELN
tara:strand:- start:186 stop:686 length:501 start_codon:yes stop_codon:yes gene_type:complete